MRHLCLILGSLFVTATALVGCGASGEADESGSGDFAATGATTLLSPNGETPLAPNVCAGQNNGSYCGAGLPGADPAKVYYCYGGNTYTALTCPGGCSPQRPGVNDFCAGTEEQHVVVSLLDQRMRAYEGSRCVRELPISSGKPGFESTLHGGRTYSDFNIMDKLRLKRMATSNLNGESYDTDNVPWDVQISFYGVYLHGAFWSNYGPNKDCGHCGIVRSDAPNHGFSHGCINERVEDARWMYHWLPPAGPRKLVHVTETSLPPNETCEGGTLAQENGCYSNTLAAMKPAGSCVQSRSDSQWYRCVDGTWKDIAAPDATCVSTTPLTQ